MSRKTAYQRARRARLKAAAAGGGSAKGDIVYQSRKETDEEFWKRARRKGGFTTHNYVNDEGLKAVSELPNGAEFTVNYQGLGSQGSTRFVMNKDEFTGRRTVSKINEDGTHERAKQAKTNAQLKDAIDLRLAHSIVIHNGGKTLIPKKTKRQEKAKWDEIVRNWERAQARQAARKRSA